MIQYVFECLAFQLLFLVVYDLLLKRETFFQWNRFYLLATFLLSVVLPWVRIEALKTTVSQDFIGYPAFMWQLDGVELGTAEARTSWLVSLPTEYVIVGIGSLVSALWFGYKLFQIYRLKKNGTIHYYQDFTKVVIKKSEMAFSFFKHIFLGERIQKENEANIVAHELVHIKQWHTADLLFFELMRIAFWFNPLVYSYQNRVSELHEFIADSVVAKTDKKDQYQKLLAEAFRTRHISFVNQFFKSSLIKKRIVMLSKEKSKKVYQFKYLLLVPLVLGMLIYSSCELESKKDAIELETPLKINIEENSVPFAVVDEVPIFPGCENASDKKACFQEKINEHIRKHFNYPLVAQEQGIQGRVSLLFMISKDGSIKKIRKRGPHELLESEAVRIIERLPKMEPGKQDGQAVDVPFAIPITFRLKSAKNGVNIIGYLPKEKYQPISLDISNLDNQTATKILNYNNLIKERNRLLSSTDQGSPLIVNLDEQLISLKLEIIKQLNTNETIEFNRAVSLMESNTVPFALVDKKPTFPGCAGTSDAKACFYDKIHEHVRKHFRYPNEAQELGIQGRVGLVFTISQEGIIKNIKSRGPHALLKNEAERIVKRLPQMKPGMNDGEAVDVLFSIPITFKLN